MSGLLVSPRRTAVRGRLRSRSVTGAPLSVRCGDRTVHVAGGSRRNLQWVLPHTHAGTVGQDDLLLLADAQTPGGLLVAGEQPGA